MKRLLLINRLMTLFTLVLLIALVACLTRINKTKTEAETTPSDTTDYEYSYPDSPQTLYAYYRLDTDVFLPEIPKEKEVYFAFARYYEASLYAKAYRASGDEAAAARFEAVMAENAALIPAEDLEKLRE